MNANPAFSPATGPLAGLKVLELGQLIAGPFGAKTLGDFGADVIKIEPPGAGDPLRQWRLMKDGTSVWWQVQSRNKQSLALDLKQPAAQVIVRQLAAESDVLIENFRPGAMEGWGLGPGDKAVHSYFKLFVTTEELDYQQLLQSGLGGDRAVNWNWKPIGVSDEWCTHTMKIQLTAST